MSAWQLDTISNQLVVLSDHRSQSCRIALSTTTHVHIYI